MKKLTSMLAVLAACVVTGAAAVAPAAADEIPPGDASIRFGTFNMQFLPAVAANAGCCEEIPDRPRKIAERIKASGYDVIALNEGMSEPARADLVAELRGMYPHYIQKVKCNFTTGGNGLSTINGEDSGLMLFSRYPFGPLLIPAYPSGYEQYQRGSVEAYSAGVDWWDQVACHNFNNSGISCSSVDDFGAKGVAHVRIAHPTSGEVYNVFLTHTDAQCETKREAQMGQAGAFIQRFTGSVLTEQPVILLGDLNIDGNVGVETDGNADSNRDEWRRFFVRNPILGDHQFFGHKMHDSWERDKHSADLPLSLWDKGVTTGHTYVSGSSRLYQRLDYVVRNDMPFRSTGRYCVQHSTVAYNLRGGNLFASGGLNGGVTPTGVRVNNVGDQDFSDHYGVNADINLRAPLCSSKEARVLTGADMDVPLAGRITHKGSMQWYRIDNPGTYRIGTTGGVKFDVYATTDTSSPLEAYSGATYVATGPFYIRAFHPNRAFTGDYQLTVHKATGLSNADPIVLLPGVPLPLEVPSDDMLWFRVDAERADNTAHHQTTRFYAESITSLDGSPSGVTLDLIDATTAAQLASVSNSAVSKEFRLGPNTAAKADGRSMFLRVKRHETGARAVGMTVGWETNLTIAEGIAAWPLRLMSIERTDSGSPADDDLRFTVNSGGVLAANDVVIPPSNWDDGEPRGVTNRLCPNGVCGAIRFVQSATLRMVENDTFSDDILTGTIPALASGDALGSHPQYNYVRAGSYVDYADIVPADAAGKYRLHYVRRHGPTPFMGSLPTLTVNDASVPEGNTASRQASVTVRLSAPVPYPVSLSYATHDATANGTSDYVPASGVLTFAPNETSRTIDVSVLGDSNVEPNETFMLNLGAAQGAIITDRRATVTIRDGDAPATLSIADDSAWEGTGLGTTTAQLTVRLSAARDVPMTVTYSTSDGTATGGSDFTAITAGSLVIPAGSLTATITIGVTRDSTVEANETFGVSIGTTHAGVTVADGQAQVTILDDEDLEPPPCLKCYE